jgi:pyruvate dehydrogenase E2 component (dihydrolipoamide acetyltransferase)
MGEFLLPDLGEGLTEAQIVSWRVAVGDEVHVDQVVVEVETAKAAVEVPVPFGGRVAALHAAAGQSVAVGRPLITVAPSTATGVSAGAGQPAPAHPAVEPGFAEPGVAVAPRAASIADTPSAGEESSGNVLIGYGTSSAPAVRRRHGRQGVRRRPGPVPVVSPLVRKLARDSGVDVAAVRGTGPGGLVRRRDVEAAQPAGPAATPADGGVRRIPLTGVRRTAAELFARSRREIPEATVWVDVDATGLLAARDALRRADPARPVSLLALLARFAVLGLQRHPELNARVERDEIVLHPAVHLGFAAQTDRGLMVPVVHGAQAMSTRALSATIRELTARGREGVLRGADLSGGTFTVNNYGVFGVDGSAAIINHPEVAILGIGRIIDRPWALDGAITVRKVCQLTLAFDHRVCDGGVAGGFLRFVADCVEAPVTALGDL